MRATFTRIRTIKDTSRIAELMPTKHPKTERIGGPGAAHENAKRPDKVPQRRPRPEETKSTRHTGISGGGGERDSHHTHDPRLKGSKSKA